MGGQEEEEEEENSVGVTEVEEDESFSFLKGHQDAKNPGKLEIGNQRYLSVKTGKIENGFVYNYFCAQRKADKGGKVCRATLTVETNEDGSDPWPLVKTGLHCDPLSITLPVLKNGLLRFPKVCHIPLAQFNTLQDCQNPLAKLILCTFPDKLFKNKTNLHFHYIPDNHIKSQTHNASPL